MLDLRPKRDALQKQVVALTGEKTALARQLAERDQALAAAAEREDVARAALATAQADLKAIQGREKAAVEAQTKLKKAMTDKGIKLP